MLYATIRQRKIHVKNPVTVIQNGINVDTLMLDMDEEWKDMTSIVCVFTTKYTVQEEKPPAEEEEGDTEAQAEGETEKEPEMITVEKEIVKEVLHTFGEPVLVPWENLTKTGTLSVSCTGFVNDEKRMTTMMPDSFWNIVQNGAFEGESTFEPTPSLYDQIVAAAAEAQAAAQTANRVSTELLVAKENGEFDGKDGVTPTVTIGTVVTGLSGGEAQVTNSGTSTDVVLNFVLPRGLSGKDGAPGRDGSPGRDGRDGKDGERGPQGLPGRDGIDGKDGKDAEVTAQSVTAALGYQPLNGSDGIAGQFAISDGKGGISWTSLTNVAEVGA